MNLAFGEYRVRSLDGSWQLLSGDQVISSHARVTDCFRSLVLRTLEGDEAKNAQELIDKIDGIEETIRRLQFQHAGIPYEEPEPEKAEEPPRVLNKVERAFFALNQRVPTDDKLDQLSVKNIITAMRGDTSFFTSDEIKIIKEAASEGD